MNSIIRNNAKIVPVLVIMLLANIRNASLSDALDTTLIFNTGGDAGWIELFSIIDYNGDVEDAARSGYIDHNQESWMRTTVTGPGTLSFYWKVSSEGNHDFLEFYIDSFFQSGISGSVDWHQMSYTIPSGSHNLKWRYVKDESHRIGSDSGYVDKVEWTYSGEPAPEPPTPEPPPPTPGSLSDAMDTTLYFMTGGHEDWFIQTETSYFDGDAAQRGLISNYQYSWIQTAFTGPGTSSFYCKG